MRVLRQHRFSSKDAFVHGFRLDLDAPHELEDATRSKFLRKVRPLRQDDELERLSFDPARVESVLRHAALA
jgi:hypothetical protein